jgi:hypothetical protein
VTAHADAAETRLRAQLAGAAINGMVPKGASEFRARGDSRRQFKAQVEDANLPDGTVLNVLLNNQQVGQITISFMRGELQLNTNDGDVVPVAGLGSTVVITDQAGATIVGGAF